MAQEMALVVIVYMHLGLLFVVGVGVALWMKRPIRWLGAVAAWVALVAMVVLIASGFTGMKECFVKGGVERCASSYAV
jgi:hypothetical protein